MKSLAPIVLAGAVVATSIATYVLGIYLPSFNTPHTPIEGIAAPPAVLSPTAGIARRLVVIVADGLSFEVARDLAELAPLRQKGVFRRLGADFPTYTSPALTTFVTGVGPRDSGVRLNGDSSGTPGVEGFVDVALAARVPVHVWSREFDLFPKLMRAERADVAPGRVRYLVDLFAREAMGAEIEALTGHEPTREIALIHIDEADHAGHYHGAASPEYAEAARMAGAIVARQAASLDLRQDTLVVLSDHGHLAVGGHGGVEPEVSGAFVLMAGGFARSGVALGEARMRDVASTLALFAGVSAPKTNLGRPMLDALALGDEEHSVALAAPFGQACGFLCALSPAPACDAVAAMLARLKTGDPEAWPAAEALIDDLYATRERSLAARAEESRTTRTLLAGLVLAIGAVALGKTRKRWAAGFRARDVAPSLVFAAMFLVVLVHYRYAASFSAMKGARYFYGDAEIAVGVAAVTTLIAGGLTRVRPFAAWLLLVGTALPFAALAAWVGADPRVLPPPIEGVLVFELSPLVAGAAITAVALAALSRRLARV